MFKKFEEKEQVSGVSNVKSSVQKGIIAAINNQCPYIKDYLPDIIPKKDPLRVAKCQEHIEILVGKDGWPAFFQQRDSPYYPTLRVVHQYPFMLPKMQVDKGAIKFILSGANIMCPGLTSPGAKMTRVPKGTVVAITAEGKEEILAIGLTAMSTDEILSVNKGVGIENIHYLGDGLWHVKALK